MYQVILESVLGIHRVGDRILVNPCIPPGWNRYQVTYHFRSAVYRIDVENSSGAETGVAAVFFDNKLLAEHSFPLLDDGLTHEVRVVMGVA
jgi:cellobiose phosphorylase